MIFKLMEEEKHESDLPIIKVIGVGGGGCNAVSNMYDKGIVGVDFAIANTDNQALEDNPVPVKIKLGANLKEGRGAGNNPEVGRLACEESIDDIKEYLSDNTKMLFVTAGMGGGTGTGAAPVIAKTAREMGILTVGIVTLPFTFEGSTRIKQGKEGLEELIANVDTYIVISNDKLRQMFGSMTLRKAFGQADNVLTTAARGIAEIITVPGYVNVDFEDVKTVMSNSGVSIMGSAVAEGETRAKEAVDQALNSPLLEDNSIVGSNNILVNITSGIKEVTMDEIFEITAYIQNEAGNQANLIWGNCYDENYGDGLSVTIIATGFEQSQNEVKELPKQKQIRVSLDDDESFDNLQPNAGLKEIGFQHEADNPTIEFEEIITPKNIKPYHQQLEDELLGENLDADPNTSNGGNSKNSHKIDFQKLQSLLFDNKELDKLEDEPAYKRKEKLNNKSNDANNFEQEYSRWTINSQGEPRIKENGNSYFEDNPD